MLYDHQVRQAKTSLTKKITIKQPKEVINLENSSQDGAGIEFRKTRKMIELMGYGQNRLQDCNLLGEDAARRKNKEARRMWEEERVGKEIIGPVYSSTFSKST